MFVPLHVKSHFSAGEGTATVEELVEAVLPARPPARLGGAMRGPGPFLVRGRVTLDHGAVGLGASGVLTFFRRARRWGRTSAA